MKTHPTRIWSITFSILCMAFSCSLQAQDLGNVDRENPIKVSGGFATGIRTYAASGIENRFDPYVWTASGNINLDVYGVLLPFSFLYSTQNSTVRQPFNRFGVTPHYKWIKLYLGYTSMNFSSFTFNNNSFLGGGIELTPDNNLRFSAIYGRLRQSVESNFANSFTIPSYKRLGYGFKVGYGTEQSHVDLILFRAFDDPNSIIVPDTLEVNPQENLVLGINSRYQLTKRLGITFEYATSAINRNRNITSTELERRRVFNNLGGLFSPNITSEFYNAIQSSATYRLNKVDFEVSYARVDPGYETLSTYFFNNDREEVAFSAGVRLLKNKMYVRGGLGHQRNNLEGSESTTLERLAGNASINYAFENGLSLAFFFTNFSSAVEYLVDEFQTDSLNYVQVSQSYGLNANYSLRDGDVAQSFSLNGNYQLQNVQAEIDNPGLSNSQLWNMTGNYNVNFVPTKLRLTLGLNFNSNDISGNVSDRYGLSLGATKSLFRNKLQIQLTSGGYNAYRNSSRTNTTINTRAGITYNVTSHHSLTGAFSLIQRNQNSEENPSFSEYNGQINYRYRL
ncbi:MAG: hypothetical protein ABJG78_02405 [Cyclobacteriaceae bacterium]